MFDGEICEKDVAQYSYTLSTDENFVAIAQCDDFRLFIPQLTFTTLPRVVLRLGRVVVVHEEAVVDVARNVPAGKYFKSNICEKKRKNNAPILGCDDDF